MTKDYIELAKKHADAVFDDGFEFYYDGLESYTNEVMAKKDAEIERLNALIAMKDEALQYAAESVTEWGNYSDEYFQNNARKLSGFIRDRAEKIRASNQTQDK